MGEPRLTMMPEMRDLARHALGLPNRGRKSYRNRYLVGPGGDDWRHWIAAVNAGLAGVASDGRHDFFWLTRAGAMAALNSRERLCPEDFPPPKGRRHRTA